MTEEETIQKMHELNRLIVPLVNTIWRSDTSKFILGSLSQEGPPVEAELLEAVKSLNELFESLIERLDTLSTLEIIAAVRATFSVRDFIVGWQPFGMLSYEKVLEQQGEAKAKRLFAGLHPHLGIV